MNYKIIFILDYFPPYKEYENQPRPKYFWEKPDGSWVGIWGYDWGDILGKVVVSNYKNVNFEVLQVDYRAERIYSAELCERLVHKQFPSKQKKYFYGLKLSSHPFSNQMINYVKQFNQENVILFIASSEINSFRSDLINVVPLARKVYFNFLNAKVLEPSLSFSFNPFRLLHRLLLLKSKLNNLKEITNLMTSEDTTNVLKKIQKINLNMNVFTFNFGLDLDFWKEDKSRIEARNILRIPSDRFVIVLSQRLVPEYQIDKFIEVISRIKSKNKFICYITGHGLKDYENYLLGLINKYHLENKIRFVGYVSDEELKNYFIACNAFATIPIMFGGSNGAIKAMAIERPIIHVSLGITYEFLMNQNAGIFLNTTDYEQWEKIFTQVIDGKRIEIVSRKNVITYFSWDKTAQQMLHIIENAN